MTWRVGARGLAIWALGARAVDATQVTTAAKAAAKAGALRRIDRLLDQGAIDEEEAGLHQPASMMRMRSSTESGTESDDDGYSQVAQAALREGGPAQSEQGQISDATLKRIVASRVREAKAQHKVMKQFMKDFARNLKLSVLEDSKGDMPEEERLADIAKLKAGQDIATPPAKKHTHQKPDLVQDAAQVGHKQHQHQHRHRHHAKHAKTDGKVHMLNGGPPHQARSIEAGCGPLPCAVPGDAQEELPGQRQPVSLGALGERYDLQKPMRGARPTGGRNGVERQRMWGAVLALMVCMVAPVAA